MPREAVGVGPGRWPRQQVADPELGPRTVQDREDGQHSVGGSIQQNRGRLPQANRQRQPRVRRPGRALLDDAEELGQP
eukprot:14031092-Alexandrium_andersonii.AAC.1